MPDGDKFERQLRGKGWRSIYRLSCNSDLNGSLTPIVDQMMMACAAALRDGLQDSNILLQKIGNAVCEALRLESKAKKTGLASYRDLAYLHLSRNLDNLNGSGAFDLVQSLKTTAQSVFLKSRQLCDTISDKQVLEKLAETTIERVVETRFLAPVREGIMETQQHSIEEQTAWEQRLKMELSGPAKKMLVRVFRSKVPTSIRAPKRLTPRMKMSLESLNQGLKVLAIRGGS